MVPGGKEETPIPMAGDFSGQAGFIPKGFGREVTVFKKAA